MISMIFSKLLSSSCRNLIEEFKSAGADFTIENKEKHTVMQVVFSKKVNETAPLEEEL